jgi:hypothetical protein
MSNTDRSGMGANRWRRPPMVPGRPEPDLRVPVRRAQNGPDTRARASAVAGTIRTDGATVAAKLLLDAVSQERPPVSA